MAYRDNADKPRYSLITHIGLLELARVYTHGAKKYADDAWRKGMSWRETFDSAERHMQKFLAGEDFDEDSGLHHMAHAAWNCLTLVDFHTTHPEFDDRYMLPKPPDIIAVGPGVEVVNVKAT